LFLNIQRQLDNHGLREHWFRAVNKLFLLSTYAIFRLGFGTMSISDMARDMLVTWLDLSRSGIAVFDALVSCKLMGRKPLYISTDRGSRTP
jgi:hypothetical protein